MSRKWINALCALAVLALTLSSVIVPASAQASQPGGPSTPPAGKTPTSYTRPPLPGERVVYGPRGQEALVMNKNSQPAQSGISPMALATSGGPDHYGYTWTSSAAVPADWIEATTQTDLVNSSWGAAVTASDTPVDMGFDSCFQFYWSCYNSIYISTAGAVGFDQNSLVNQTFLNSMTSYSGPQQVITPYMAPFLVNSGIYTGKVTYATGTSSQKYFVVEWKNVKDNLGGDYTFETILYEDGSIDFIYKTMSNSGHYYGGTGAAIKYDNDNGLSYRDPAGDSDMSLSSNLKVHFVSNGTPSTPQYRGINIHQPYQGMLTAADKARSFDIQIYNSGTMGDDTYDISAISGAKWPVILTDNDGKTVSSITIHQNQYEFITATIQTPTGSDAFVGANNTATLTFTSEGDTAVSQVVHLQLAVPTPFAQIFNQDGRTNLMLALTAGQATVPVSENNGYRSEILELPNGNFFIANINCDWDNLTDQCNSSITYMITDHAGQMVRQETTLNLTGLTNIISNINSPTIAVTPDGHVGLIWNIENFTKRDPNDKQEYEPCLYNQNLYFSVLNQAGDVVLPPENLTKNTIWGDYCDTSAPISHVYYNNTISAASDNRFVLSWDDHANAGYRKNILDDVYYSVRSSNGTLRKAVTPLTKDVLNSYDGFSTPVLVKLTGGEVLVFWQSSVNGTQYSVIDSSDGSNTAVNLSTGVSDAIVAGVQFSTGNILLFQQSYNNSLQYVILAPNTGTSTVAATPRFKVVSGPIPLVTGATNYSETPSAIVDANGHAAVTWRGGDFLLYALINSDGSQAMPPQVINTSYISNISNQALTTYSWRPDASQQDVWVSTAKVNLALPDETTCFSFDVGNLGLLTATSTTLTVSVDDKLSYQGSWWLATPTSDTDANNIRTLVFSLDPLDFLYRVSPNLCFYLPPESIGSTHKLDLSISAAEQDAAASNNTFHSSINSAGRAFLPTIMH